MNLKDIQSITTSIHEKRKEEKIECIEHNIEKCAENGEHKYTAVFITEEYKTKEIKQIRQHFKDMGFKCSFIHDFYFTISW